MVGGLLRPLAAPFAARSPLDEPGRPLSMGGGGRDVQRNTGRSQTEAFSEHWDPISFLIASGRHKLWSPSQQALSLCQVWGLCLSFCSTVFPVSEHFLENSGNRQAEPVGLLLPVLSGRVCVTEEQPLTISLLFLSPFYFRTWGKVCISQRVPETLLFYQLY